MLFSAHSAPARPAVEIGSVRRSLNTPVIAIAQLPVGPASAAIAVHIDSGDGLPRYTLAVRSERSREVVFFAVREEDLAGSESSVAAEAALSLAEGMGFLFEEELLPISGAAAASIWGEFVDSRDSNDVEAATEGDVCPAPLLTKFRLSPSQFGAQGASVGASEAAPHPIAVGAEVGAAAPDSPIAHHVDR